MQIMRNKIEIEISIEEVPPLFQDHRRLCPIAIYFGLC